MDIYTPTANSKNLNPLKKVSPHQEKIALIQKRTTQK